MSDESRGELAEDSEMGDCTVGRGQKDELVKGHLRLGALAGLAGDGVFLSIKVSGEVGEVLVAEKIREDVTSMRMAI